MPSPLAGPPSPSADPSPDHLDRLPDSLLLLIFDRIADVKALGRCSAVSRRFSALVPLVDRVLVRVDCVVPDRPSPPTADKPGRGLLSSLSRFLFGGVAKPLHAFAQFLRSGDRPASAPVPTSTVRASYHSPAEVLRNFKGIRRLRIELPAGELGVDEGAVLMWKASYGSSLDHCVVLGASGVADGLVGEDGGSVGDLFCSNKSLKLRVVWTISALIAASARHYLLQPIIGEHESLERLDLCDGDGQGMLSMDRRQLNELRVRGALMSGNSPRTLVPALSMRLWYAAQLELPDGVVLKGATLVAIRPSGEQGKEKETSGVDDVECWVGNAFEEPFRTAAKMLVKGKTYNLEMNSF